MEKALELEDVSVVRDGSTILDGITMSIAQGENVAVIGSNGSGKTTLIKLLRGDMHPYYDERKPAVMKIFGQERWNLFDIRSRMGVVSMDLQSMFRPDTKVFEVICSGFFNSLDVFRNVSLTDGMRNKAYEMALMMGIEDLLGREIGPLSLGEMRRTLIARALVTDPALLVLDEPMTGLDIVMKSRFRMMFDILIEKGVSIVMITHDLSDIPSSVRRVIAMKDGRIFIDGDKEEVLTDSVISDVYGEPIKVENHKGTYLMHLSDGDYK